MNNYEIPKEIKAKPKLFGLEMKELTIVIVIGVLLLTVLNEKVHSSLSIPYYIVCAGLVFWAIAPSSNNPGVRNFKSIYYLFKKNNFTFHAIDVQKEINNINFEREMEGKINESR